VTHQSQDPGVAVPVAREPKVICCGEKLLGVEQGKFWHWKVLFLEAATTAAAVEGTPQRKFEDSVL
jgi:hypothetical protein